MRRYVTLVGTRDVEKEIKDIQIRIGGTMCDDGWTGRSGKALGSDENYFFGALLSPEYLLNGFDNFIAMKVFCNEKHSPETGLIQLQETNYRRRAYFLGIGARGTAAGLRSGGIALHSRNSMQVLGQWLVEPSRLLICHAKPLKGLKVSGGTNTAVALAHHFKIPVVNTWTDEGMGRVMKYLKEKEKRNYADIYNSLQAQAVAATAVLELPQW